MEADELLAIWEAAGLSRRQREVAERLLAGKTHEIIASELGIAVGTVGIHASKANIKLRTAQVRFEDREFYRALLAEVLPGPTTGPVRTPLYREIVEGEGEVVRLNAGPLVTVEDLMRNRA